MPPNPVQRPQQRRLRSKGLPLPTLVWRSFDVQMHRAIPGAACCLTAFKHPNRGVWKKGAGIKLPDSMQEAQTWICA